MKFDPNATPECDVMGREASHFPDNTRVVFIADAEELERRARSAEEKLTIIYQEIEKVFDSPLEKSVQALWIDIARTFKAKGL